MRIADDFADDLPDYLRVSFLPKLEARVRPRPVQIVLILFIFDSSSRLLLLPYAGVLSRIDLLYGDRSDRTGVGTTKG